MAYTNAGKNVMLNALGAVAVRMRLLDDTETAIVDHADGAQLKTITWDTAADGSMDWDETTIVFEVKSGVTVQYISFMNSAGDTEYGRHNLDTLAETYASDGTYTVTSATFDLLA